MCIGYISRQQLIHQLCEAVRASLRFAEKEGITYSSIANLKKNLDQLMAD
jgi:hypothetical protein